jgi:hypothetical protein
MRFEYKVITLKPAGMGMNAQKTDAAFTEQLNQQGMLGWSLVGTTPHGTSVKAFLRREK